MNFTRLGCQRGNHQKSPLQYVCTRQECLKTSQFLCCINCIQDLHREHVDKTVALKVFLSQVCQPQDKQTNIRQLEEEAQKLRKMLSDIERQLAIARNSKPKQPNCLVQILLKNLSVCQDESSFRQNLFELIEASNYNPDEQLLNQQMRELRNYANKFQQKKDKQKILKAAQELQHADQQLIKPIFTIKQSQNYSLLSPYSVKATRQGFTVVLAYPTLATFRQSVEVSFIIKKLKPDWLAVGLTSSNKQNFSLADKNYYLWISNGWTLISGKQEQTGQRFLANDKITLRYDKAKSLLIMFKNGKEYEPRLFQMDDDVWGELQPCIIFFNKGDIVDILQ